jgi:hypothetical protein
MQRFAVSETVRREVDMRLDVPVQDQALYGERLDQALAGTGLTNLQSQYFLLVDRIMRLQMHATDPDLLEPFLGRPHSKECIRIPATLNTFVDHYGLIDAEYERVASDGKLLWLLRPGRTPTPWPGRYLVIVYPNAKSRPYWSPLPVARKPVARRILYPGQTSPSKLDSGVC